MPKRDDFSPKVKLTAAIRAAHLCSNPGCLKLTAGPHSDENKYLATGHAAHIHAAAPGGPRYDAKQTPAQRKSISNALWLCRECGDIVDKDDSSHSADLLREWKKNHEKMLSEVRTKGYAASLDLLQARAAEPKIAKRLVSLLEDRRALWTAFDAEFPDRVRRSLDSLREKLVDLRNDLPQGLPLDQIILSLTKTIHIFFNTVESSDLERLKCNSADPEWIRFRDALATLRKSIGLQLGNVCQAYDLPLSGELKSIIILPQK